MRQLRHGVGLFLLVLVSSVMPARAADQPTAALSDYFPPPEEQGGWRSLLPAEGEPDDSQKAQDSRGRRCRLGLAQGSVGLQYQSSRRDWPSGHPPRPHRRRVVQGRRSLDRLQYLLQLEIIYEHGVWLDPV